MAPLHHGNVGAKMRLIVGHQRFEMLVGVLEKKFRAMAATIFGAPYFSPVTPLHTGPRLGTAPLLKI